MPDIRSPGSMPCSAMLCHPAETVQLRSGGAMLAEGVRARDKEVAVKRRRGHKAVLELTSEQVTVLDQQGHAARAMWNLLHDWWTMAGTCPQRRASPTLADQHIRRARRELPWLADLPAQAAQQVLQAYFQAWKNCWEGRAAAPAFKSRIRSRMSVDVPQARDLHIKRLTRRWGQVRIPKVGLVRFRWTKDLPGTTRSAPPGRVTGARLVRETHGWHIVFRTEVLTEAPLPHLGPGVGIDLGIAKPLALSDGTFREHASWATPGERARMTRLERKAARQRQARKPGAPASRRLTRTYDQIARYRATAKRRTTDWQHRTTTELADTFGVIGMEDLAISNMIKSARGAVDAPGHRVRQKAGLNRAITAEAWARTSAFLTYKLEQRGGHLIKVPAMNTSRRCHVCGLTTPGGRESQARFACKNPLCGWSGNADTNAACNIQFLTQQRAPQDIEGARTWSPSHQAGNEASTTLDSHPQAQGISWPRPERMSK
ncbi:transposase [Streptacidiphilus sp. N1-10]|uniref:Transposase n=1 Tax=Streptacidiphilus jeojiensis TaxID=3229225 RepID=A0ABV6XVP7_9ACTN